jgi:hypothetical protein
LAGAAGASCGGGAGGGGGTFFLQPTAKPNSNAAVNASEARFEKRHLAASFRVLCAVALIINMNL